MRFRVHRVFHISMLKPYCKQDEVTCGQKLHPLSNFEVWDKTLENIQEIIANRKHGCIGKQYRTFYKGYTLEEATWIQKKDCEYRLNFIDYINFQPKTLEQDPI